MDQTSGILDVFGVAIKLNVYSAEDRLVIAK